MELFYLTCMMPVISPIPPPRIDQTGKHPPSQGYVTPPPFPCYLCCSIAPAFLPPPGCLATSRDSVISWRTAPWEKTRLLKAQRRELFLPPLIFRFPTQTLSLPPLLSFPPPVFLSHTSTLFPQCTHRQQCRREMDRIVAVT